MKSSSPDLSLQYSPPSCMSSDVDDNNLPHLLLHSRLCSKQEGCPIAGCLKMKGELEHTKRCIDLDCQAIGCRAANQVAKGLWGAFVTGFCNKTREVVPESDTSMEDDLCSSSTN